MICFKLKITVRERSVHFNSGKPQKKLFNERFLLNKAEDFRERSWGRAVTGFGDTWKEERERFYEEVLSGVGAENVDLAWQGGYQIIRSDNGYLMGALLRGFGVDDRMAKDIDLIKKSDTDNYQALQSAAWVLRQLTDLSFNVDKFQAGDRVKIENGEIFLVQRNSGKKENYALGNRKTFRQGAEVQAVSYNFEAPSERKVPSSSEISDNKQIYGMFLDYLYDAKGENRNKFLTLKSKVAFGSALDLLLEDRAEYKSNLLKNYLQGRVSSWNEQIREMEKNITWNKPIEIGGLDQEKYQEFLKIASDVGEGGGALVPGGIGINTAPQVMTDAGLEGLYKTIIKLRIRAHEEMREKREKGQTNTAAEEGWLHTADMVYRFYIRSRDAHAQYERYQELKRNSQYAGDVINGSFYTINENIRSLGVSLELHKKQLQVKKDELAEAEKALLEEQGRIAASGVSGVASDVEALRERFSVKETKEHIKYHEEQIAFLQDQIRVLKVITGDDQALKNSIAADSNFWDLIAVGQEYNLIEDSMGYVVQKLWEGENAWPEPANPRVKQFLIFACSFGNVDIAFLRQLNPDNLYNEIASLLSGNQSALDNLVVGLIEDPDSSKLVGLKKALNGSLNVFLDFEQTRATEELEQRRVNLGTEVFEKNTNIDLNFTRAKFEKLYFESKLKSDGNIASPHAWFDKSGKVNDDIVTVDYLERFIVPLKEEDGSLKIVDCDKLIKNSNNLKLLQKELIKTIDELHLAELEAGQKAATYEEREDVIERSIDGLKSMLFDSDPSTSDGLIKIASAVGLIFAGLKTMFGSSQSSQYLRYAMLAVAGREFLKEAHGIDIFEEAGLISKEKDFAGAPFQAQLDRFKNNKDSYMPLSSWQQEAIDSQYSPDLMKTMNDIPMQDLIKWHQSVSQGGEIKKAEDIVVKGVPRKLKDYIDFNSPNEQESFAMYRIAFGLLDLFFEDIASNRAPDVSPNSEKGIEITETLIDDIATHYQKQKQEVLFVDLLKINLTTSDIVESIRKERDIVDYAKKLGYKIDQDILPMFEHVGKDMLDKLPLIFDLIVNFWGPKGFDYLKTLANQGWKFTADSLSWAEGRIELFLGDARTKLYIEKAKDGVRYLATLPGASADWLVQKGEEFYGDMIPVITQLSAWAEDQYEKALGKTYEHNEPIKITTGEDLFAALKKLDLVDTVIASFDLVREKDLKNLCDAVWNQENGKFFVDIIKNNTGLKDGEVWKFKNRDGTQNTSHKIDLNLSDKEIKIPRKVVSQFFMLNAPLLESIDFVGDKGEYVFKGVGGVIKTISGPASLWFFDDFQKSIWHGGEIISGGEVPKTQAIKGLDHIDSFLNGYETDQFSITRSLLTAFKDDLADGKVNNEQLHNRLIVNLVSIRNNFDPTKQQTIDGLSRLITKRGGLITAPDPIIKTIDQILAWEVNIKTVIWTREKILKLTEEAIEEKTVSMTGVSSGNDTKVTEVSYTFFKNFVRKNSVAILSTLGDNPTELQVKTTLVKILSGINDDIARDGDMGKVVKVLVGSIDRSAGGGRGAPGAPVPQQPGEEPPPEEPGILERAIDVLADRIAESTVGKLFQKSGE